MKHACMHAWRHLFSFWHWWSSHNKVASHAVEGPAALLTNTWRATLHVEAAGRLLAIWRDFRLVGSNQDMDKKAEEQQHTPITRNAVCLACKYIWEYRYKSIENPCIYVSSHMPPRRCHQAKFWCSANPQMAPCMWSTCAWFADSQTSSL